MTRLLHRPKRDEDVLLAACASSRPAPAVRASAADVLFDLRAEFPTPGDLAAARAKLLVPLHRPASGLPALLAEAQHVMRSRDLAFEALMAERGQASAGRYADLAAATWVDATIGRLIAEKATAVADVFAARPELRHDHAVLMALAPVVAMLKGSVA